MLVIFCSGVGICRRARKEAGGMASWWTRQVTRRALSGLTLGGAGLATAWVLCAPLALGRPGGRSDRPADSGVEQNRVRRAGVGLRAYDPERASRGFSLFAPPAPNAVFLSDL